MRYQGGKSRIACQIAAEIERERESHTFVSLFCGTCSIESKVKGFDKVLCNDSHEYLIEMLKGVQNGYELPENISEEQYKYIREHKDEDKVLTGFVGFGCSFGGKWFGGYARNKTNTNYALQSKKSLHKGKYKMKCNNCDFKNVDNSVIELVNGSTISIIDSKDVNRGYKSKSPYVCFYYEKCSQDIIDEACKPFETQNKEEILNEQIFY